MTRALRRLFYKINNDLMTISGLKWSQAFLLAQKTYQTHKRPILLHHKKIVSWIDLFYTRFGS